MPNFPRCIGIATYRGGKLGMSPIFLLRDVAEDAFELVDVVVGDDQLALAATAVLDRDLGSQLVRQLVFQAPHVRVGGPGGGPGSRLRRALKHALDQPLGFPDRQAFGGDQPGHLGLHQGVRQAQQGPGVAHLNSPALQQFLGDLAKLHQAEQV